MELLTIFRKDVREEVYYLPSWYCKPSILRSICFCLRQKRDDLLFVTCSKYGCKQFLPEQSKTFPVFDVAFYEYDGLNCLLPIFLD